MMTAPETIAEPWTAEELRAESAKALVDPVAGLVEVTQERFRP